MDKRKSYYLKIGVITLLLGSVLTVGAISVPKLINDNQNNNKSVQERASSDNEENQSYTEEVKDEVTSHEVIDTKDWETFRSYRGNFQFKHPADWEIKEEEVSQELVEDFDTVYVNVKYGDYIVDFDYSLGWIDNNCEYPDHEAVTDLNTMEFTHYKEFSDNDNIYRRSYNGEDAKEHRICKKVNNNFGMWTNPTFISYKIPEDPNSSILKVMDEIVLSKEYINPEIASWDYHEISEVGIALRYPIEDMEIREYKVNGLSEGMTNLIELSYTENKLSKPLVSISAVETDKTPSQWIEHKNYCPETFDSCSEFTESSIDGSIQYSTKNRHYGSIDTWFRSGDYLINITLGNRMPDDEFSDAEVDRYETILDSVVIQ